MQTNRDWLTTDGPIAFQALETRQCLAIVGLGLLIIRSRRTHVPCITQIHFLAGKFGSITGLTGIRIC